MMLHAKVKFNPSAINFIKFPVISNIRLSIWPVNARKSMPSEFHITKPLVGIDTEYIISILIDTWHGVERYFIEGCQFKIGSLNTPIGEGVVIKVE